jgi:hypothetical protein
VRLWRRDELDHGQGCASAGGQKGGSDADGGMLIFTISVRLAAEALSMRSYAPDATVCQEHSLKLKVAEERRISVCELR